ncbi:MAG TPA: prephenate dehydrogenase/arogenate dehydrogenase family protein [Gemmatimonadales bacterium]|nr:prephenate dehydrogenase/arogenate dehydrogenase family protein [Gemmatimonadales bacterium]
MRPSSLAVIGLGAIGGSVAWQARVAGISRVVGYARDRPDRVAAIKADAVDDIADDPLRAVAGADLVVLATPPQSVIELLETIAPALAPGALVTDVASIKLPIMQRAVRSGLAARFAGSHPYTGTHVAGWNGARPDRLTGALVYVCSTGDTGETAASEVLDFWTGVFGAHAVRIDAARHDRQLGWTSHLPQAVATALAHTLSQQQDLRGASYGTGARDTTRLAASPAEMWADILLLNRGPVLEALEHTREQLGRMHDLLTHGDQEGLVRYLETAANFRRALERDGMSGEG